VIWKADVLSLLFFFFFVQVVVKCLLSIHHIFTHNDEKRYLINVIFVDDYIRWVQTVSDAQLRQFADAVERTVVSKESVELNLEALELLAREENQDEQEDFMMEIGE
jgi:hypothetical protein